jgi:hypothetical protein
VKLVLIEWIDSLGCGSSWEKLEHAQPRIAHCRSVGWLLHDGDDCKTVVPHVAPDQGTVKAQGVGDMTIPAVAIIRIIELDDPTVTAPSPPAGDAQNGE